jgi:ArsR family transcriptional regulator
MARASSRNIAPIDRLQDVCRALADRTRLRILALLGNNEVCVCHIHDSLALPQPTVSRHLAYLLKACLVDVRRDGVLMHYRIAQALDPAARKVVAAAIEALLELPTTTQDRKQFERTFGKMYVLDSAAGGTCCAPRA